MVKIEKKSEEIQEEFKMRNFYIFITLYFLRIPPGVACVAMVMYTSTIVGFMKYYVYLGYLAKIILYLLLSFVAFRFEIAKYCACLYQGGE